jgi:hypothetical protein
MERISLGSARASRAGFGVSPKQAFLRAWPERKVRDGGTPSPARETRALPRSKHELFQLGVL